MSSISIIQEPSSSEPQSNLIIQNQQLFLLLQQKQDQIKDLLNMILLYKDKLKLVQQYEQKILQLNDKLDYLQKQELKYQTYQQDRKTNKKQQIKEGSININCHQIIDQVRKIQIDGWCQTELHICKSAFNVIQQIQQRQSPKKKRQKVHNFKSKEKEPSKSSLSASKYSYSIYNKVPTLTNQTQFRPSQDKEYQSNQNIRYSYQETFKQKDQQKQQYENQHLNQHQSNGYEQPLNTYFDVNNSNKTYKSTLKKYSVLNKSLTTSLKTQNNINKNQSIHYEKSFVFEKLNQNNNKSSFFIKDEEEHQKQNFKKYKKLNEFLCKKPNVIVNGKFKKQYKNQKNERQIQIQGPYLHNQQKSLASTGFSRQKKQSSNISKMINLSLVDKFQKARQDQIKNSPSLQNLMRIRKCYQMLKNN